MGTQKTHQQRASRIRGRLKKGGRVSAAERKFLENYEKTKRPPGRPRKHDDEPPAREYYEPTSTSSSSSSSSSTTSSSAPALEQPSAPIQEKSFAVDFSEPPAMSTAIEKVDAGEHDAGSCPFGDKCPHCLNGVPKKQAQLGKCGTTGRVVYAPLSEQGARFFAGVVLNTMAISARLLRPDRALIEPDDDDYDDMTAGVQAVVDRRIPQLSMWDDIAKLGFAFGAFGRRAMFDPAPIEAKKIGGGS